jgi:hypothetical protein
MLAVDANVDQKGHDRHDANGHDITHISMFARRHCSIFLFVNGVDKISMMTVKPAPIKVPSAKQTK